MRVCSQCGAAPERDARFCKECGHSLPIEAALERPPVTTGRQMNVAGGNIEQNVIHDHTTHIGAIHVQAAARTHNDNVAEYQRTFRSIVDGARTFGREWLNEEERRQLDVHAGQLGLQIWERQESEHEVLGRLNLVLQPPPRQFWSLAVGSNELARQLTSQEAAKAAALHLDREEPSRLLVWRTEMTAWQLLPQVPEFQAAVMVERLARFQALLADWARRGQPTAMVQVLREAARHLSNHDIQSARRFVSGATGRQITIPPDVGAAESLVAGVVEAPIEGTWEAEANPSVRVVLLGKSIRLKNTYPVLKQVEAAVVGRQRTGEEFSLDLDIVGGDFRTLRGMAGKIQADRLSVDRIRAASEPGIQAFQTRYRRI